MPGRINMGDPGFSASLSHTPLTHTHTRSHIRKKNHEPFHFVKGDDEQIFLTREVQVTQR